MDLAQNLKKILKDTARRIFDELSFLFTDLEEEQTLRRLDNSFSMESSPNPLTTENLPTTIATSSQGTSEKITMEIVTEPVIEVREWAIQKIQNLHDADRHRNAKALAAEFDEWINLPCGEDEISYICIENDMKEQGWTEEQEVDISPDPWYE